MLANQCQHLLAHLLGLVPDKRPMRDPVEWALNKVGFAYAPRYVTSNRFPVRALDVKLSTFVQGVEQFIEILLSLENLVAQETQGRLTVNDNFVEGIDGLVADDLR